MLLMHTVYPMLQAEQWTRMYLGGFSGPRRACQVWPGERSKGPALHVCRQPDTCSAAKDTLVPASPETHSASTGLYSQGLQQGSVLSHMLCKYHVAVVRRVFSPRGVFFEPFGRPLFRGGWLGMGASPAAGAGAAAAGCAVSRGALLLSRSAASCMRAFVMPFLEPFGRPLLRGGGAGAATGAGSVACPDAGTGTACPTRAFASSSAFALADEPFLEPLGRPLLRGCWAGCAATGTGAGVGWAGAAFWSA